MPELLGIPAEKVNEQRLYRALDKLLPHKEALEKHLKNRLGSLFDLEYDLLLYDVTSTYFEGQCEGQPDGPAWLFARQTAPTASRSASGWWFPSAACRWATKSSRATATT